MKALKILVIVLLAMFSFTVVNAQKNQPRFKNHPSMKRHHRHIIRQHPI
jgi:hypothetical protein